MLKQNLPKVHKARLRAVALFVFSLISEATVNLQKLALSGLTSAQPNSVCKRFSRLLIWVASAKIDLGKLILKLIPSSGPGKFILCIDRTNWKYGQRHINFLVLSLYVNGVGYPIVWRLLPKRTRNNLRDRTILGTGFKISVESLFKDLDSYEARADLPTIGATEWLEELIRIH